MKKIFYTLLVMFSLSTMAQSVDLKVNYQKGDKYRSKTVSKNYSVYAPIKSTTYFQTATVKEVGNDVYKLEIGIDKVLISGNNGGKPIEYDSSAKQMDPSVKGLHSRHKNEVNTVIGIEVNKKGKTLKKTTISGSLIAETSPCKTHLLELPDEPLEVDTEWDGGHSKNNLITAYNYTVTKITDKTISVALQGTQVTEYTYKPQATFDGTIEIDRATGVPTKKNIKVYMAIGNKKAKVSEVTVTTEKI